MIVYQASKRQFIHDTFRDDIEDVLSQQYLSATGCVSPCRDGR